jgi:hypothetical protein
MKSLEPVTAGLVVQRIPADEFSRLRRLDGDAITQELRARGADVLELEDDPAFRIVG